MASLADYFAGVTGVSKYSQILSLEMIPNFYTVTDADTGEVKTYISSYTRNLYVGTYETKTFVFEGVPVALANSLPSSVVVTDVGGVSHMVNFVPSVSDGSEGTAIFENERNAIAIHRTSPHMRTIEVTHTEGTLSVQSNSN